MNYSDVVWLPNALVVTAGLGAVATWRWKRKGALVGLRWTGVAMLPLSLYAIGLYRLVWNVSLAVSRFVTGFAWRPSVWFGLLLGIVAVALIVLPGRLNRRLGGGDQPETKTKTKVKQVTGRSNASAGDDMSDIEDILKKHGIG